MALALQENIFFLKKQLIAGQMYYGRLHLLPQDTHCLGHVPFGDAWLNSQIVAVSRVVTTNHVLSLQKYTADLVWLNSF